MTKKPLRHILLVEDDPDIQEIATILLEEAGDLKVCACGTAAEGFKLAQETDPDLILLDFMMPGLDGREAFAAFGQMKATADTPVIFMTGRVEPEEISQYRAMGALGVIPKPFDPETLHDTIQGMWERYEKTRMKTARRQDLAALRRQYAAELPERLRAVENAAAALRANGWDGAVVASLYDVAHRIAGSAAIYGFGAVSDAAMRIGTFANQKRPQGWVKADPLPLLKLIDGLAAALRQSIAPETEQVQAS